MGYPVVEPGSEPEINKESEASSKSSNIDMTMDDWLRRLRLRRFQQDSPASDREPSEASASSNETIKEASENETPSPPVFFGKTPEEERVESPALFDGTPEEERAESSEPFGQATEKRTVESASPFNEAIIKEIAAEESFTTFQAGPTKPEVFTEKAIRQTSQMLERVAAGATEETKQLIGQVATIALRQTSQMLERLVEDATDRTSRVMEKLAADASSQVRRTLEELVAEDSAPPLNEAVEGLSGEVRRIGRELFKATRAAERNQDLFDSAIAELQRLTQRVEQVPAQLHGSESITEVKASLCREMLGVADALEASMATAEEGLERLQERIESAQTAERPEAMEEAAEGGGDAAPQPFWRRLFWRRRSQPPASPAPSPEADQVGERVGQHELLEEALVTLDQWLDGQQLIYERLQTVLQSAGVRQIESEGQPFDPSRHRAVSTEARSDVPAGTIVAEERRGYTLDGKILRYAEVIVAKNE